MAADGVLPSFAIQTDRLPGRGICKRQYWAVLVVRKIGINLAIVSIILYHPHQPQGEEKGQGLDSARVRHARRRKLYFRSRPSILQLGLLAGPHRNHQNTPVNSHSGKGEPVRPRIRNIRTHLAHHLRTAGPARTATALSALCLAHSAPLAPDSPPLWQRPPHTAS
jgi:hypothetical protein